MPDHAPRVRRPWGKLLQVLLLTLFLVTLAAQFVLHKKAELPLSPDGPYVVLSQLGFDGERTSLPGLKGEDVVSRDWSPLCRVTETQETVVEGEERASLYQDVYELSSLVPADAFMDSLIGRAFLVKDPATYDEIAVPGWDRVLVGIHECFARSGNRVVHIYIYFKDINAGAARVQFTRILTLTA